MQEKSSCHTTPHSQLIQAPTAEHAVDHVAFQHSVFFSGTMAASSSVPPVAAPRIQPSSAPDQAESDTDSSTSVAIGMENPWPQHQEESADSDSSGEGKDRNPWHVLGFHDITEKEAMVQRPRIVKIALNRLSRKHHPDKAKIRRKRRSRNKPRRCRKQIGPNC